MIPARARKAIEHAAKTYGVPTHDLVGPKKRRYRKAVDARYAVIRELYDPSTQGTTSSGRSFRWGASAIARALGIDHTTVIYAVSKMGLRS